MDFTHDLVDLENDATVVMVYFVLGCDITYFRSKWRVRMHKTHSKKILGCLVRDGKTIKRPEVSVGKQHQSRVKINK